MFMSYSPIQAAGVQEHVLHLSTQLRTLGHTVTIFGPKPKKNRYKHYQAMGEKIYFPLPGSFHGNIYILNERDKPEKIFIKEYFDILHLHDPFIPFAAWNVLEKSSIPAIATFHCAWENESIYNILNSFIPLFKDKFSSLTQGALFVSQIVLDKWKSICDKKLISKIIPNATDIISLKPKAGINSIPNILFVARLVNAKGALRLLKVVELLMKRRIRFTVTIIGDGNERDEVLATIKNRKLQKVVQYLGEIKGPKRFKYFSHADIFCAPYVNEAASISVLEAVSAGLPIVGYKIPIFSDLLNDYPGKEFLVDKTDIALADALEKLIKNPSLIASLKEWCLKKREGFSWTVVAKQTEEMYYQVLQKYEKKNI